MTSIIPDLTSNENTVFSRIDHFFIQNSFSKLLKRSNFYKESGVPCVTILKELFTLVFTGKNLFRTLEMKPEELSFRKNTAYRFLNSGHYNWSKLLLLLATKIIAFVNSLTSDDRQSVLIFDDSLYSRSRSKKVELMTRVFDHTTHKYVKGFRMLTMGWSDGNTFLPIGFSLLSSQKPEKVLSPAKQLDKRTVAYKRRAMAVKSTTDVMIDLLRSAANIPAKYVLFDSWFAHPKTILRVKQEERDVICMVKVTEKIHYRHNGKWQPIQELRKLVGDVASAKTGIIGAVIVQIRKEKNSQEFTDVRIVFVQDRTSKKWLALLSTDLKLTEEEVVRIYSKRWDIEVFFKVCKSYLALAKEYQGRNYDAQVAATSIVFLRYTMLAVESRNTQDDRTIGELFYYYSDEMEDIKLSQALIMLIDTLRQVLNNLPVISQDMTNMIMDTFLNTIPQSFKERLLIAARCLR